MLSIILNSIKILVDQFSQIFDKKYNIYNIVFYDIIKFCLEVINSCIICL